MQPKVANLVMNIFSNNLVMNIFSNNLVMDHFWTHFWSVTERDKPKYFRAAQEVDLDASSGVGTIVNRLSSVSCVDFHYSFVRVRHLDATNIV